MKPLRAVIWDFDGTLVDTRRRNLAVCRKVVSSITGKNAGHFPALASLEAFDRANRKSSNWRTLYVRELGLSEEDTDRAGKLWTEFQLNDETPADCYRGIDETVAGLRYVPQGIVSQNSQTQICSLLEKHGLLGYFSCVIGYEQVQLRRQKPAPDGLLLCIDTVCRDAAGTVLYVGDHEGDARCVAGTNKALRQRGSSLRVACVGAAYGVHANPSLWSVRADYLADNPKEIASLARSLFGYNGTPA